MSIAYNTNVVRDGLVLYLDAINKKSYPGTGTVWYDLSGNNENNTLYNGVTYTNNNSMYYDGISEYTGFNRLQFNDLVPFTIFAFIRLELGANADGTLDRRTVLGDNAVGSQLGFYSTNSTSSTTGGFSIWNTSSVGPTFNCNKQKGDIFSIAITRDSSNAAKGYVDGSLVGTSSLTSIVQFNETGRRAGGFRHFYGNIYELKIYNRTLSDQEIEQNFNAMRGRYNV